MANDKAFKVKNGLTLEAFADSKAVTAVDVFVYDTSKDSDGGAWRKRTQATSWYNEALNTATRGSRKEFPAVAVIVAEADKVTIYDGDDPSLPMWMVFNKVTEPSGWGLNCNLLGSSYYPINCIEAVNGTLCVGSERSSGNNPAQAHGLITACFVSDKSFAYTSARRWAYNGFISDRNNLSGHTSGDTSFAVVNGNINDVAMTVLPNAPIDPATGLPVPTIAVATDGGVSVIKDDGTVVDITYTSYGRSEDVYFTDQQELMFSLGNSANEMLYIHVYHDIPAVDINNAGAGFVAGAADEFYSVDTGFTSSYTGLDGKIPFIGVSLADIRKITSEAVADEKGLALIDRVASLPTSTSFAAITSTYNTGWMNGDIKGAFLSDTDDTDLVAGNLLTAGQVAFTSGWQFYNGAAVTSTGISDPDGGTNAVEITSSGSGGYFFAGGTADRQYYRKFWVKGTGTVTLGSVTIPQTIVLTGTWTLIEDTQATSAGTARILQIQNVDVGDTLQIYAPYVDYADADRSVNNNGLIVNGTVTRTPVATGADLVAYSGFSSSNYLEQPYNSDLDFGTGDFCVMGWVKGAVSASTANIVSRCSSATTGFQLYKNTTSTTPYAILRIGSVSLNGTTGITDQWNHVVAVRKSGVAYIYKNGVLESSVAATADVSGSYVTQVGWSTTNPLIASLAGAALWRISATAPTAEAIAKIYNDEKVLFQEGAQATLYGASDAVTALAHDSDTGILSVGTSAGRSDFQGLRRVNNTTNAVGVAISAAGGMIVEE